MNKYVLYLNEEIYGVGNREYMIELIDDYTCRMNEFEKDSVTFRVELFSVKS